MKIFGFVKEFFIGLTILSRFTSINSLSCISMINQACKARLEIFNDNNNNPVFYPFSIKTSKCSGSCNDISGPYAKICVPDVVKNLNLKVFNLMSRTNETKNFNGMKHVNVNVDQMQLLVMINSIGIKTNADVNVRN